MAFRACFGMRVGADALIGPLLGATIGRPLFAPPFFSSSFGERKELPRPVKKRKRTVKTGSANHAVIM